VSRQARPRSAPRTPQRESQPSQQPSQRLQKQESPGIIQQAVNAVVGRRLEDMVDMPPRGSKPLGTGSFGTVWKARTKPSGQAVAVKALDKRRMKDMKVPDSLVMSEVNFMRECTGQDWFVQLFDFLDSQTCYYLILEFCDGGNLEDAHKELEGGLREHQAAAFVQQLLSGIAFLHSRRIIHRDIKPANAMLVGRVSSGHAKVKLGDFGIAVRFDPAKLLQDKLGTPAFMAPEMHLLPNSTGYDMKVDMWAAGTLMVFLLAHEYPFVDKSGRLLKNELLKGDLPIWAGDAFSSLFQRVQEVAGLRRKRPSPVARDLVRRLLQPRRKERPHASEALTHAWFRAPPPSIVQENELADDIPLLQWADFEEGFAGIHQELSQVAQGVVNYGADIQVGYSGCEPLVRLDPNDDRLINCVVCRARPPRPIQDIHEGDEVGRGQGQGPSCCEKDGAVGVLGLGRGQKLERWGRAGAGSWSAGAKKMKVQHMFSRFGNSQQMCCWACAWL
ncbi:unnamed protein product, partial [Polarella glacialis]